jgi:hypothetical protein
MTSFGSATPGTQLTLSPNMESAIRKLGCYWLIRRSSSGVPTWPDTAKPTEGVRPTQNLSR